MAIPPIIWMHAEWREGQDDEEEEERLLYETEEYIKESIVVFGVGESI